MGSASVTRTNEFHGAPGTTFLRTASDDGCGTSGDGQGIEIRKAEACRRLRRIHCSGTCPMDQSLIFGAAAVLFCIRDARLLAGRRQLFLVYPPLLVGTAAGCGLVAEILSASEARALLGDFRFWLPAAAIHGALSLRSGRRSLRGKPPDWLSILPTPVLCVVLIGAGRHVLAEIDGATGLAVGLALGISYGSVAALASVTPVARRTALGAMRFASAAHVSALLLVPALAVPDRPLAIQEVDWPVTGFVLASVAAILGASLIWHRARSR